MKIPERSRILYAESNADDCYMLSVLLGFANIEVICANSVAEAWRLAQNEIFDMYLLDVRFPDGSGLELCGKLRRYAPHKPIVFYSGYAYETDKQKGLAVGANAYLTKPYVSDLTETILSAIKLSKTPFMKNFPNPYTELQKSIA